MELIGKVRPKPDEIEISVFGSGYGECIVIHVGSGKWVIIDSCMDASQEPISLKYLRELGVSVEKDVFSQTPRSYKGRIRKGLSKS